MINGNWEQVKDLSDVLRIVSENISSEDRKELQNMLDEWCKKQTGTRTVHPNYKKYVKGRKEWFE